MPPLNVITSPGRRVSFGRGSPVNSNPHQKNAQYLAADLSGQVAARQPKPGSLPQHHLATATRAPSSHQMTQLGLELEAPCLCSALSHQLLFPHSVSTEHRSATAL